MTAGSEEGLSKKKGEKLERRIRIVEKRDRILLKDHTADSAVMEEVFDKPTLMAVYSLLNAGVIDRIFGVIKSGKESKIFGGLDSDGNRIAIKIYLTTSAEFKKGMLPYITGDPRFKFVKRDTRSLTYLWAQKEFRNLQKAYESAIPVPKPFHVEKNVLVMEFIGDNSSPAPTLKEKPPSNPRTMYKVLLRYVKLLYQKAKLVHGDLSEYNIINLHGKPILFDMSQAVHIEHPMSNQFLLRDLQIINRFFKKFGVNVKNSKSLSEWIKGK